ncbi:MAG TPA: hypothetical protein VK399_11590, partial [Longimicrobiaceae bacterium]|nr:hypothetical protein [Longimicrobiaceae bacterium]
MNPRPDLPSGILHGRFGVGKSSVLAEYAGLVREGGRGAGAAERARTPLPDGITRADLLQAIADLDAGVPHPFGHSMRYDVLHEGRRYPPKAVVGLAATRRTGKMWGPKSFTGGVAGPAHQLLQREGFTIVQKREPSPFPEEVEPDTY